MVAFLPVHKMTKRQPVKKATGALMAVANLHRVMNWEEGIKANSALHLGGAVIESDKFSKIQHQ